MCCIPCAIFQLTFSLLSKYRIFLGYITYDSSPKEYNSLRIASFPNGTTLTLSLYTGVIRNDRFENYPFFRIELMKNGIKQIMLYVTNQKYLGYTNAILYMANSEMVN